MAHVHPSATLEPSKLELLHGWIARQRWYAGKGGTPRLRTLGSFRFDDPVGKVGIETLMVLDTSISPGVVYQVPLTYRDAPMEGGEAALLGTTEHSVLGTRYVYDGCRDTAYATELLRVIVNGWHEAERSDGKVDATCVGSGIVGRRPRHARDGLVDVQVAESRVLRGEQSNTSIIYEATVDGVPTQVITKVFRVLHTGTNPDVEVQSTLTAAGCTLVPRVLGSLSGSLPSRRGAGPRAHGDLALAQEFFPDVEDAWRTVLTAARAGDEVAEQARTLGAATAEVHQTLRETMPTAQADPDSIAAIAASMRSRLRDAVAVEPALEQRRDDVERVIAGLEGAEWPVLQRIHGDYHLGQVLDVPDRGWVLLDFEGEPLRPLAERTHPDAVVRDIAGMLRSFDYAAGTVAVESGEDRTAWAQRAREAFLTGYTAQGGDDLTAHSDLLAAYELDKALYELVYEARNRPDWMPIPRAAVDRLLGTAQRSDPGAGADSTRSAPPSLRATETAGSSDDSRPDPERAPVPQTEPIPLHRAEADQVIAGVHRGPHGVLGAHPGPGGVTVRVLRPLASTVQLEVSEELGSRVELRHEYEGIWVGVVPGSLVPDYRVITTYEDGVEHRSDDPYRFMPTLGAMDLHLIGEGRHEQLWDVLGAQPRSYDGPLGPVHGTSFAVWAPHARAVQVIGDFNQWDGQLHMMRALGGSGVWELYVPDAHPGHAYKLKVLCADDVWRDRADPLARWAQVAPETASVVVDSHFEWSDQEWLEQRAQRDAHTGPMSVYEVHLSSWRQGQSYRDLAEHLVNYVTDLGFTHVELLPVMDHPYPPSWGYHVTSYYAPNSRLGHPDDFRYLVDTLHRNGIGVILDWVPGHFATDEWALARFDGTPCYEHPDRRRGWHPEWGSYIFDFGRPQVRNFLVANALYWLEEFHVDGLRVDGVASMLYLDYARGPGQWEPNVLGGRENLEAVQLLQETNATAYKRVPGIVMIAEESTSWPGVTAPTAQNGLGFGLKWNMGWMHDSLDYLAKPPVYRQYHHHKMTFGLTYAWTEKFVLPISHDEVVHGKGSLLRKMPGDRWEQLSTLRAYLAFMWAHPGKPLLFMGCEFAQESEWADGRSLDWWLLDQPAHWGVHLLTKHLNAAYQEHPALWQLDHAPSGFQWLEADDVSGNTYAFLRYGEGEGDERPVLAAVFNFSGSEHTMVNVGLPRSGGWREVLNTDAEAYGGAGIGNLGRVEASEQPWQGQPYSAQVTLGPLSAVWLVPEAPAAGPQAPATVASTVVGPNDHLLDPAPDRNRAQITAPPSSKE